MAPERRGWRQDGRCCPDQDYGRGAEGDRRMKATAHDTDVAPRTYWLRRDDTDLVVFWLYKAGGRADVRRAVWWGAVGGETAIESERAIPWATSFRTLPHAQPDRSEHAMLRGVAGSPCCSPPTLTWPRRSPAQCVGVLPAHDGLRPRNGPRATFINHREMLQERHTCPRRSGGFSCWHARV